jgi:hypothetical protein
MQVPLTAYAEDCAFTGEVTLTGDRLSDFLASTVEDVGWEDPVPDPAD